MNYHPSERDDWELDEIKSPGFLQSGAVCMVLRDALHIHWTRDDEHRCPFVVESVSTKVGRPSQGHSGYGGKVVTPRLRIRVDMVAVHRFREGEPYPLRGMPKEFYDEDKRRQRQSDALAGGPCQPLGDTEALKALHVAHWGYKSTFPKYVPKYSR